MAATPFTINVPQKVLDDLKQRLEHTRWADSMQGDDWTGGINPTYLKDLVNYWATGYDWRKAEAELNRLAQFTTDVDGVKLHFVHETSDNPEATPLLLVHGWPDSFYRFHKVIPQLKQTFHVVAPSIPGFGFSGGQAMTSQAVGDLFVKLMASLGYDQFAAAGGDKGTDIIKLMAVYHPDALVGIHLTDVGYPTGMEDQSTFTEEEKQFAGFIQGWWMAEGAYNMIQSTKPFSVATALNDSPAGLAAWVVSFLNTGADQGDVEGAFGSRDELLTNLTIYWVTGTAVSAAQMYQADARAMWAAGPPKPLPKSTVPAGVLLLAREAQFPREWAERTLTVKSFNKSPRGGHFAALEEPDLYVEDVTKFFTRDR